MKIKWENAAIEHEEESASYKRGRRINSRSFNKNKEKSEKRKKIIENRQLRMVSEIEPRHIAPIDTTPEVIEFKPVSDKERIVKKELSNNKTSKNTRENLLKKRERLEKEATKQAEEAKLAYSKEIENIGNLPSSEKAKKDIQEVEAIMDSIGIGEKSTKKRRGARRSVNLKVLEESDKKPEQVIVIENSVATPKLVEATEQVDPVTHDQEIHQEESVYDLDRPFIEPTEVEDDVPTDSFAPTQPLQHAEASFEQHTEKETDIDLEDIIHPITETGLMGYEEIKNLYAHVEPTDLDEITKTLLTHTFTLDEIKVRMDRANERRIYFNGRADNIYKENNYLENDESMELRGYSRKYAELSITLHELWEEEQRIQRFLEAKQTEIGLISDLRTSVEKHIPLEPSQQPVETLTEADLIVEETPPLSRLQKFKGWLYKFAKKKK